MRFLFSVLALAMLSGCAAETFHHTAVTDVQTFAFVQPAEPAMTPACANFTNSLDAAEARIAAASGHGL